MWRWVVILAACEPETTSDCATPPSDEVTVEVGTGESAFEPLTAALAFYQGPQGGYHVYGGVRTTGLFPGDPDDPFGPESPLVSFRLYLDGAVLGEVVPQPRYLGPGADGAAEGAAQLVVIQDADPPLLDGRAVEFEVTVEDRCGLGGTDRRASTLAFDSTEPY
jgi:hypothetical protein